MIQAAASVYPRPNLWGVTVLTSMSAQDVKIFHPTAKIPKMVASLAAMGADNGADATICSAQEVAWLRKNFPKLKMKFVTPGIRPQGAALNDQSRVMTPGQAAALGIDFIVVGRPITHSSDPRQAAQEILAEMESARVVKS
jgi:orotidine-5'-phosphate decarboxylase